MVMRRCKNDYQGENSYCFYFIEKKSEKVPKIDSFQIIS